MHHSYCSEVFDLTLVRFEQYTARPEVHTNWSFLATEVTKYDLISSGVYFKAFKWDYETVSTKFNTPEILQGIDAKQSTEYYTIIQRYAQFSGHKTI